MPSPSLDRNNAAPVEFGWRPEEAGELGDTWANFCYSCGACLADCLAAKHGIGFNPRDIMLKVRYGLGARLLVGNSILWQCFKCDNCRERCPQELKPVDVINALREMLADLVYPKDAGASPATSASCPETDRDD